MNEEQIINWLLEGDVAIQNQVHRDLLGEERPDLQERIAKEGWGAEFLSRRKSNGHWGAKFYSPKWTSTNYTLLDLKNLNISPKVPEIGETIAMILRENKIADGGVMPIGTIKISDLGISGMVLNYASYFEMHEEDLQSIIDLIISLRMPDGGFNYLLNWEPVEISCMYTTICVLEGIQEYIINGFSYRLAEIQEAAESSRKFYLNQKLFLIDSSGENIDKKCLMLSYPSRWKYNILWALDCLHSAGISYDPRIQDALDIVIKKQRKDGKWPVQARHPGKTHFEMEKVGGPSRWNTLRALRVLNHFKNPK